MRWGIKCTICMRIGKEIYDDLVNKKMLHSAHEQIIHRLSNKLWKMNEDLLWNVVYNQIMVQLEWEIWKIMTNRHGVNDDDG